MLSGQLLLFATWLYKFVEFYFGFINCSTFGGIHEMNFSRSELLRKGFVIGVMMDFYFNCLHTWLSYADGTFDY